MPLDDLSLDLTGPAAPTPSPPQVMTRVLRLPTRSLRHARSIVRLQLDRLSPLPASDTAFDLTPLRAEGGETVYALGLLRRSVLSDPAFRNQRTVVVMGAVEGRETAFRFRNGGAVDDREARWLQHAPRAVLIGLGLAAVALAGNLRADQWRERRLPEIAAEARLAAQQARAAEQRASARAEWTSLERADASTRFLCAAGRIAAARPGGVAITSVTADPEQVSVALAAEGDAAALSSALALPLESAAASTLTFPREVCG